ncbi:MAG: IctB family putative bicarbonate transporter [Synechococcaceae cyanobacterium]
MVSAPAASPLLLRWQGLLASWPAGWLGRHLATVAGLILCALMAGLPLVTREGLGLLIGACCLLWLIWALRTPAAGVGRINAWLLAVLAVAVLATGFSPVPRAAFQGLIKLVSYLGVYALMRQLLAEAPAWWDRIVAALLAGELVTSVIGLRQLYGDTSALARWSDNNSVAEGTVRIYSTLENPNLLGGFLLPVLPIAVVAFLRWRQPLRRLYALLAFLLGVAAMVLTYSRGAWMGMVASLALLAMLLLWRAIQHWPLFWRRTLPLLLLVGGAVVLLVLVTQVEPLRVRVMSLFVGREDSSNNFRINVWQAAWKMIEARPALGIGPGNKAFNLIYPIYQTPKFNALSAYSIPLELLVEAGIPGLFVGLGLAFEACRTGLSQWRSQGPLVLPSLAAVAVCLGLGVQGLTDTIFFRPEVQLTAFFCLATLAASQHGAGRSEPRAAASEPPEL